MSRLPCLKVKKPWNPELSSFFLHQTKLSILKYDKGSKFKPKFFSKFHKNFRHTIQRKVHKILNPMNFKLYPHGQSISKKVQKHETPSWRLKVYKKKHNMNRFRFRVRPVKIKLLIGLNCISRDFIKFLEVFVMVKG